MIRFLFGRPGSGKTHYTVERIRELIQKQSGRVFLIVPEQQAYSTERELLAALPPNAGLRFTVLSFTRLCDRLADLYGGRARHTVTRAMRSLLMWENLRQLKNILETYGGSGTTDPSLCGKMLSTVEELGINGVSSASLERAADQLSKDAPLRDKLRDIALVSAAYSNLLTEVYGEDPADRLIRAADKLAEHDFFADSYVFFDAFTSFTVQEYVLMREILRQAEDVTVTFGCESRYDSQPQFDSMKDAIRRLTRLCEDLGLEIEDVALSGSYRATSPELRLLETSLWSFDVTPDSLPAIPESDRGAVRAVVCPTIYDEAQAAALHILEARERGIPYGEIAVTVRDTAMWKGVLDAALEQYDIPYFLSERVDLNAKPAARLLLTALRCVARGWQIEDILTLCKTGLLPLTMREIDYFAEYTDTWKLTGRRMTEEGWSMNPDGYRIGMTGRGREILCAANQVRETVMSPLLSLKTKLKGATDVTEQCRALYEYLNELNLRESLMSSAETYLAMGQIREAGEQVRLWSFLTETLATVANVMKDADPLSPDELCTALTLVFADTDIGSVPARHDCVTVGDASTLRVDNIRVLLALGLCEGEFPRSVSEDSLLSDQDKEALEELGIELTSRAERLTSDELLFVWRAFTKPSESLILSYSSSTPDGQAKSPSSAITRVGYLLPYLKPTPFRSEYLAEGGALRYRTPVSDQITKPTVRRLLGEEIWLSQSRLQTYSRCPYSYYGSHILSLREPAVARFDNLNAGNFLHHVMEQYLKEALDEENRLRPLDREETEAIADAIINAYMEELCGDIRRRGRLLRFFDRLRRVALMLIDSIQQELSNSDFTVA
ncbi:MAG: PD-(D/E)XK nuclease family protein, partial [Clostridia bacterium]|nr:PD-(D/E)XK nuclease family protein [Clostridia bacterium]